MKIVRRHTVHGLRVNIVLGFKYPGCERVFRVISKHGNLALQYYRARIHFRRDEVNGAAGFFYACIDRLFLRVQPFKIWKQGRVYVDNAPAPAFDKPRAKNAHETRKADKIDFVASQMSVNFLFKGFLFWMPFVIDDDGGDIRIFCALQTAGIRPV